MGGAVVDMGATLEKLHLETDLRRAIEEKQFCLHYQPKVDLNNGRINGVEALIRWKHPEQGIIPPLKFIPLAEETGLIEQIGEWVLRSACEQSTAWQEAGLPPLIMAVNLSVRQFFQPYLIERIQHILEETRLDPQYLELEITESIMMDAHSVLPVLQGFKKIGVRISLDDFGMGYSSLSYLKELPIDIIKIDQSFIRNCTTDAKMQAITKAIIAMGHQLEVEVIAEGIESRDHLIFLQQNLCDKGQGYLFSKPLSPEELIQRFHDIEHVVNRKGIPQELSKQQWLEEALKNARQELQDTVKQQQGMIFKVKENNGRFIHTLCDGELLYKIGYTPEQIIGRDLRDIVPDHDVEYVIESYRRASKGEENVSYEREINNICYLASLRPIRRGGQIVEIIGSCVDITKIKIVEKTLRLSESKYRLIADNMQDLICVVDANGVIQYASPSHTTVLGFPIELYEGNSMNEWIYPEDIPYAQKQLANMVSSKTPVHIEFRLKNAHGGWICAEAHGSPVLDGNTEAEQFVVVARDITERKKSEELLRKSEKLSVVGHLAAGVAHEIRNPLTTIKGFVQLLAQREVDNTFFSDILLSEVNRMEKIVEEFLTLAKPHTLEIKETTSVALMFP